ncbi:SPFH domain-containing protein [Paenibacillus sp. N3/727]|uniref:SPFH domain-containing protein n=1 Tax=Paenibacillus sp. N3/727 TaxID=2925845 RepID=UPI001F53BE2A|nr:SPFH domain-containing protein [Paenibacillus sp. N3/727]UNK19852.1 SPFH domain-containing protein [Paenibacillus sp. N3/727]
MAIIEVIKYDGPPGVFAWRYPNQELGTWTQLIVNESQEVIFFKGGQALDLFTAGRHTLNTANIPILSNIVNLPFGGKSPFSAEVWFVNKLRSLDVKWGTNSPIQLQDPKYNIIVSLRAFGQFGVQIEDSRKFLLKMVGTLPSFDQNTLVKYFRGVLMSNIHEIISSYIVHKKISVVEINAYAAEISKHIHGAIAPAFQDIGLSLLNFYVDSINIPDNDPAAIRLKEALAKKAEMDIIGYTYHQERSFDTLEGVAKNPGSNSGFIGAGLGVGMGLGMVNPMYDAMNRISGEVNIQGSGDLAVAQKACSKCGNLNHSEAVYCSGCGQPVRTGQQDTAAMMMCSDCGNPIPPNSKFCLHCGDPYHPCPSCGQDVAVDAESCSSCGKFMPRPCRECGEPLNEQAKFCPSCGSSTVLKCGSCDHEIKPGQKFCMECGNKLT